MKVLLVLRTLAAFPSASAKIVKSKRARSACEPGS
jgi:hypothetical protein